MKNIIKGWLGEKAVTLGMWALLDDKIYHRINDVILNMPNGTTQIDHILVSVYGIFVIETKNIQGWIFGSADSNSWSQSIFGKKNQFQNPLQQNYRHTKSLSEYLKLDHQVFKPVVFFVGDCEFKTPMPSNVLNHGLIPYITEFKDICLSERQVQETISILNKVKQDTTLYRSAHLASLHERYESTAICPKCGGTLVERISKKTEFSGKPFWGCSNYPKCKYINQKQD